MSDKTSMKYRVFAARNPKTEGTLLRPVVTSRNSLSMKQLVAYAKNANYVRGQQKDLEGLLGGFIEAMQDRAKAGYSINVNDWFIISGQLRGTVGEDRALTAANEYHVTITASKDLKVDIDNFSWSRVDDNGIVIKVENITSPNGKPGEVTKGATIVANGKNLAYDAAWGDSVKVSYAGLMTPIQLTPSEQSATYLRFNWPAELSSVPAGTELEFEFRLHGGEGMAEQSALKTVTLLAGPAPTVTKVATEGKTGVAKGAAFAAEGTNLAFNTGDSVKAKWTESGAPKEQSLTPTSVTPTKMSFAAVSAFDTVPDNTELTFEFSIDGQTVSKTTTLVAS